MEQRSNNGSGHAGGSHDHAAARRVRMAQPLQAQYEEAGGNQICGFKKILRVAHFFSSGLAALGASFLWNILSMRSVIRKPPVTLIMAEVTAAQPRISARVWCWSYFDPAITSEPISEMPEMALVADMSGVCSRGGTREITW